MSDYSFVFREIDERDYREHPFTGSKGFAFGGMMKPSFADLSQEYFDAANLLVSAVERNKVEDYHVANPVLFMFRHSIELQLKSMVKLRKKTHRLETLFTTFRVESESRVGKFPAWLVSTVMALDSYDPSSTAFRYAAEVEGEVIVGLDDLKSLMARVRETLQRIHAFSSEAILSGVKDRSSPPEQQSE